MRRTICMLLSLLLCIGALLLPVSAEETPTETTVAATEVYTLPADATEPTQAAATTEAPVADTTAQEETTAAAAQAAEDTTAPAEPAAEDTTAATEPEKETEPQQETTAADTDGQAQTPPLSPYHPPKWEDYNGDREAYDRDEYAWYNSLCGRYYRWRGWDWDEEERFDPAFRAFYADDPELKISGHFVYKLKDAITYQNKKRVTTTMAIICDYFDTDEAAKKTTTLHIPATIDGYPAGIDMSLSSSWTAGLSDCGYTNDSVKTLIVEEGMTSIAMYAFSHFTALKTVRLPSTLTTIGIGAFKDCTSLKKVTGGETLESLGSDAFGGCAKLSKFEPMEHIHGMDGAAFYGCAFKTLTLAGDVSLGGGDEDHYTVERAFGDCKKLKKVTFLDAGKKATTILDDGAFLGCDALKTVVLPKTIKEVWIEDRVFEGCTALQTIENTGKVRFIGRMAFKDCTSLTAITLPAKLQRCDFDAFLGCKNLKTVTLLSKDTGLFDKRYDAYNICWGDASGEVTSNFLLALPKSCTVLVVNKDMKDAVKAHRFKGTVKICVTVKAPKTVKLTKQSGKVTLKWSKVKAADGYRVWSYNAKTGKYTKLATVKAGTTSVTLKTTATRFAVRAYRIIDKDVSWSPIVMAK